MQALLIYELSNKNHLKNINDQNFVHFMMELRQRLLLYLDWNRSEMLREQKSFTAIIFFIYNLPILWFEFACFYAFKAQLFYINH